MQIKSLRNGNRSKIVFLVRFFRFFLFLIPLCFLFCRSGSSTFPWSENPFDIDSRDGGRIQILTLDDVVSQRDPVSRPLPFRDQKILFSGLDQLVQSDFFPLRDRSFALLTNATAVDQNLDHILPLLLRSGNRPMLVLEPEHGLYGNEDELNAGELRRGKKDGLRILSLYSPEHRAPREEDLIGIDLILVDIFNLPVRCYTYISTLTYILEEAERLDIEVLILDRPNPYGFWRARGATVRPDYASFVSLAPVPYLYSLTPGEYALHMAATRFPRLRLRVIPVLGYERDSSETVLRQAWINPSPHIPDPETALVYAGLVFLEGTNVSVGRGTARPFIYTGAPWLRAGRLIRELRALKLPGLQISAVKFTPRYSLYTDEICNGIQFLPLSIDFQPLRTGYEYLRLIRKLHPKHFEYRMSVANPDRYFMDYLWGGSELRESLDKNRPWSKFQAQWEREAGDFEEAVAPHRLY